MESPNKDRYCKIDLARCCIARALTQAARGTPQSQSSNTAVAYRRKASLVAGTGRIRVLGLLLETPTSGFDPDSDMSGPLLL